MVVVMPWYPAIRVAENMAMLDAMSDGRAVFGFGRGLSRIGFEGLQCNMGESTRAHDRDSPGSHDRPRTRLC